MTTLTIISLTAGILLAIISILIALGGTFIWRSSRNKAISEIQERVTVLLQSEIAGLKSMIERLQEENVRLNVIFDIMKKALTSRGIFISIDGNMVSIRDKEGVDQVSIIGRVGGSGNGTIGSGEAIPPEK